MNGPSALSAGLKQYESGDYEESAKNLQVAIELGVPDKLRANAHKHLAFIHCSSNRERQCRDEFRKALAADPAHAARRGRGRAPGVGADLPVAEGGRSP